MQKNSGTKQICRHVSGSQIEIMYSRDPNKSTGPFKRTGYYIGLFEYYIKIHFLFNKIFWKNSEKNNRACTFIRDRRVIMETH